MKIDLSCPIEIRSYALSYISGGMEASVRLYNLSPRRIDSVEAVARWQCGEDGRKIVRPFSLERLHVAGESMFTITLDNRSLPDADRVEILFSTVRFEDGDTEWHAGNGPYAELAPLPAISREELALLRQCAGADAVRYPAQESQTWSCVCGRINSNSDALCMRCSREHFTALSYTPDSVNQAAEAVRLESEAAALRTFSRRRAGRTRKTLLTLLIAVALTALWVFAEESAPPRAVESVSLPLLTAPCANR